MNHGGNLKKLKRDLDIDGKLIDFSANINPLGMAEIFKDIIRDNVDIVEHYPDFEYHDLKEALGRYYKIDSEYITVANGAEEVIRNYMLLRRPKTIIINPTFSEYQSAAQLSQVLYKSYQLTKEDGFKLINRDFLSWIESQDFIDFSVFLCNPNNPTGILYSLGQIKELASQLKKRQGRLILDESFIEFTSEESFLSVLEDHDNVLLIKSLTKFFAIPGLRLGFAVSSDQNLIEEMEDFRADWSVNALADLCGQRIGDLEEYKKKSYEYVKGQRERLIEEIEKLDKIDFIGGKANFLMVYTEIEDFFEKMLKEGIVLRKCDNFLGLNEKYFRIAVRTEEENSLLIKALKKVK